MAEEAAAAAGGGNDNDDEQQDQDQEEVPLIESLEDYIRSQGIHLAPPPDQVQDSNVFYQDVNHAANRFEEGKSYQDSVHRSAFAEHDEKEGDAMANRGRFLRSLEGKCITVASRQKTRSVPLDILASSCDTVLQMAKSQPMLDRQSSSVSRSNDMADNSTAGQLTLDLQSFECGPVESFLAVATSIQPLSSIPDDHIVDICRISHYVQCITIFNSTIEIIESSIDSDNCLSICHLADQLAVQSLFEKSVSHLIERLDDMQDHEHWEDFPTTLRHRVITMRNAVQSSILGRGQKTAIFFSSSDEFLAIFSDNIREQRERLAESKRRQEEVIEERLKKGGRHCDPYGGSVKDAAEKIERQEKRLETLETFYQEQKMIFSSGGGGVGGSAGAGRGGGNGGDGGEFRLGY